MKPLRALGALVAVVLSACGPNYRYVYDGEGAFERCYALDYDQDAAPATRQQCWSAWLQSYSFGSGVDRIEYARARSTSQGAAPTGPQPDPSASVPTAAPPNAPQSAARVTTPPTPPPTPTLTAPPATEAPRVPWSRDQISGGGTPVGAPTPTTPPTSPENEPPGAACGRDCNQAWRTCGARCVGNDAACVARCDDTFRDCMRGCF